MEELVRKWAKQGSDAVVFRDTREILIAAGLLEGGRLPDSARVALARILTAAIDEASASNLEIKGLHIRPSKKKPKNDVQRMAWRVGVNKLLREGKARSIAEACEMIAKKNHRSPDTIRRDYERDAKAYAAALAALQKRGATKRGKI